MSVQIASYLHNAFHSIPYAYQSTSVSFPSLPLSAPSSSQSTSSVPARQRTAPKVPAKPTKTDKLLEVVTPTAANVNPRHYAFNPSPISDIDNQAYEDLVRFEDDILSSGYSSEEDLAALAERFSALQQRLESLLDDGCLGEHTLDLWLEVLEQAEDILADAIEDEEILLQAEKDVAIAIETAMEQTQHEELSAEPESLEQRAAIEQPLVDQPAVVPSRSSKSKPAKVSKASPPIASSSSTSSSTPPPPPVPTFEQKLEPDEDTKTFRKRRIDVAVPGKESAKFLPLRAFFIANVINPYPSAKQKRDLATAAGIDESSVSQWFTNTRRRSGWGAIMKKFANDKKEDMKSLIKKTFGDRVDSSFVMNAELQAAINSMRVYMDKLAREDVGDKFTDALQKSVSKTREEKLQLYEDDRKARIKPRKGVPVIKEELVGDDIEPPQVGKKRKRKVESEEPNLGQRSDWSVQPSQPTAQAQGTQSKFAVVTVKTEPIVPSLDLRPSPVKKARVARKKQEKAPSPPKDLHRRRGGVPDLRAPQLSACPTLLELDVKHTPSPMDSMQSVASSSSSTTLVSHSSLPLPHVGSFRSVKVSVPSSHVATTPLELSFESRQRSRSATVVSQELSHQSSVTQFASTLPTPCDSFVQQYQSSGTGEVMWNLLADSRQGMPSRSSSSPSVERDTTDHVQSENMDQHVQAWDTMQPEEWRASGHEVQVSSGSGLPMAIHHEGSYTQWGDTQQLSYAPIQQQQQQAFGLQNYSYVQETQPLGSYPSFQSMPPTQSFQHFDTFSTPSAEPMPPSYDEFMGAHPSQSASESVSWISVPQSLAMHAPQPAPAYSMEPTPIYQSSMVNSMEFVLPAPSYTSALAGAMKIPDVSMNWGSQLEFAKNQYPQEAYAAALSTLQQGF
ncbi:hypothetical protein FRB96_006925 [Tulasnella sp. 330]|nr:hypothetical protein FRB96_006925 [Tulasnella sp. 330]KAG8875810.1 hypothetical protein FRB97_004698 [Tulasnella sp. 331]